MVEHVIDTLLKEAYKSPMNIKHAACILKGNKIVSIGHNYMPNYTFQNLKSIHAEVDALSKLPKIYKLKKCNLKMVVIRLSKSDGGLMMSKPCDNCSCAINKLGNITTTYYSK